MIWSRFRGSIVGDTSKNNKSRYGRSTTAAITEEMFTDPMTPSQSMALKCTQCTMRATCPLDIGSTHSDRNDLRTSTWQRSSSTLQCRRTLPSIIRLLMRKKSTCQASLCMLKMHQSHGNMINKPSTTKWTGLRIKIFHPQVLRFERRFIMGKLKCNEFTLTMSTTTG